MSLLKCPRCGGNVVSHDVEMKCVHCGWNDYEQSIEIITKLEDFYNFLHSRDVTLVGKTFGVQSKLKNILKIKKVFQQVKEMELHTQDWHRKTDIPNVAVLCEMCEDDQIEHLENWIHLPLYYVRSLVNRQMYVTTCMNEHTIQIFNSKVRNGNRLIWRFTKTS